MIRTVSVFAVVAALAFAADPFLGTWKPAAELSKISPGSPERRQKELYTFESAGKDAYRVTIKAPGGASADSRSDEWKVDGAARRSEGGNITTKIERVSDRHLRMTVTGPKGESVNDWVVSQDGKTLTWTRKGTGATSGRALDERLVYQKQ